MEDSTQDTKAVSARNRRTIGMIFMAVAGVGALVLVIVNAHQHRWASLTFSILLVLGMACGLFAQHQLGKQQRR